MSGCFFETRCTIKHTINTLARSTFNTQTSEVWHRQLAYIFTNFNCLASIVNSSQNVPSIVACHPCHFPCWTTKAFGHLTVASCSWRCPVACCPNSVAAAAAAVRNLTSYSVPHHHPPSPKPTGRRT